MRKIIHIDCDCFFAAVEQLDNPELRGRAIAIGGGGRRGVIATASYEAREFGVRSAMPGFIALQKCPHLHFVRPRMARYKEISEQIRAIFHQYTELVEPMSIDEAYLDVTESELFNGSASLLAEHIRQQIANEVGVTVSAGIANNKLLAKIASDWQKPNGQTLITPDATQEFMHALPLAKLHGVGKKSQERLAKMGMHTCGDLQTLTQQQLIDQFGRFGAILYKRCRGEDDRLVSTDHVRKSVSVERTYMENLDSLAHCQNHSLELVESLQKRLKHSYRYNKLRLKMKFHDFTHTTVECAASEVTLAKINELMAIAWHRGNKPVRLLGVGVRLMEHNPDQLSLFAFDEIGIS